MPKFEFRLQKVLDYRTLQEQWAKDNFLATRAATIAAMAVRDELQTVRRNTLQESKDSLEAYVDLEHYVSRLDDEIESQDALVRVLESEEEKAQSEWTEAQRALKSLEMLREGAEREWLLDEIRREQGELDEWSSQRRSA